MRKTTHAQDVLLCLALSDLMTPPEGSEFGNLAK